MWACACSYRCPKEPEASDNSGADCRLAVIDLTWVSTWLLLTAEPSIQAPHPYLDCIFIYLLLPVNKVI